MKSKRRTNRRDFLLLGVLLSTVAAAERAAGETTYTYYGTNYVLSAPAAGEEGSTAVPMDDVRFVGWADGYTNVVYGEAVDDDWKTPEKALGPATGTSYDVVCLGRGGRITMTFSNAVADGEGPDFAVFENGFSDGFLELAYVEVSSDGEHFVRFPNYSYTASPVGGFGTVDTRLIYGLASKYRQGYGTPFDLDELRIAYEAQLQGNTDFSAAFAEQLTNNYPYLDPYRITHIRLVDVVGDGSCLDSRGEPIYDPYPTTGSAGFDLDAVGVFHRAIVSVPYAAWAADRGLSADGLGDADGDGARDFEEYAFGTDPRDPTDRPSLFRFRVAPDGTSGFLAEFELSRSAAAECFFEWTPALPATNGWQRVEPAGETLEFLPDAVRHRLRLSAPGTNGFYRLRLSSE